MKDLHKDWKAIFFEGLDEWDVDASEASGPETDDSSCRYSVLEELDSANAHLIAQAPNLLASLEDVIASMERWQDYDMREVEALFERLPEFKATIAKAKGESQ